jgi:hypothetical protein
MSSSHSHYQLDMSVSLKAASLLGAGSSNNTTAVIKTLSTQQGLIILSSAIAVGLFIRFAYNFVYNVFLHPYAKYPGPFLAKFTDLYAGYHAWKGDIHLDMWRCHQQYGDKVRYAPNRLNVNTVTGLKSE